MVSMRHALNAFRSREEPIQHDTSVLPTPFHYFLKQQVAFHVTVMGFRSSPQAALSRQADPQQQITETNSIGAQVTSLKPLTGEGTANSARPAKAPLSPRRYIIHDYFLDRRIPHTQ
jgi:hypothetical protein